MKRLGVLSCLLALSIGLNVALIVRPYFSDGDPALRVGSVIQPFMATNANGRPYHVHFENEEGEETVLYFFSPHCPRSRQNLENLREIVSQKRGVIRFIAVATSKDGLKDFVAGNGLRIPIVTDLPEYGQRLLNVNGTPRTIVVSDRGEVVQIWNGPFSGDQEKEVESFFGVALPGISAENK